MILKVFSQVTRDENLRKWSFIEGEVKVAKNGFGTGYPGGMLAGHILFFEILQSMHQMNYRSEYEKIFA